MTTTNLTTEVPQTKICIACKRELPATLEYFFKGKYKRDGLVSRCKECSGHSFIQRWVDTSPDGYKTCPKCRVVYPATIEFFYQDSGNRNGLHGHCKECCKQHEQTPARALAHCNRVKEYYRRRGKYLTAIKLQDPVNREKRRVRQRLYFQNSPEARARQAARHKEYIKRPGIKQRLNERMKERRRDPVQGAILREKDKRKHSKESYRKWRNDYARRYTKTEKGKAICRATWHKRRLAIRASDSHFTKEDVRIAYKSQKGKCWHCGKFVGDDYHIDHLIPLDKGGSNEARNIVISCPKCNLSKGAKLPQDWNGKLF